MNNLGGLNVLELPCPNWLTIIGNDHLDAEQGIALLLLDIEIVRTSQMRDIGLDGAGGPNRRAVAPSHLKNPDQSGPTTGGF